VASLAIGRSMAPLANQMEGKMPEPLNRSHIKAPGGAGPRLFAALARAATSKTSIPLARQSRHDDHANAATPDSYPDCRFPIQIAALHWMTTGGSR